MKKSNRWIKWVLLILLLALLAGVGVMLFGFVFPYVQARSTMPQGEFVIEEQAQGQLLLSWPEAENADSYCIEILQPTASEDEEAKVYYRDYAGGDTRFLLPELPKGMELTIRVRAVVNYRTLKEERIRFSDTAMEITGVFDAPVVSELQWTADTEQKSVQATFAMKEGDLCRVYMADQEGQLQEFRELNVPVLELWFGEGKDLPMLEPGESVCFVMDAYREGEGYIFYGAYSGEMTVTRDDLMDRNLELSCVQEGDNVLNLSWGESKGEYYEVQVRENGADQWTTVYTVEAYGERSYNTGHLPSFREFSYRVVALGGQTMEGSEFAAISETYTFETRESVRYATIWPTRELEVYADPQGNETVGTVETAAAYCVLEETDGMFSIRYGDRICYIDSRYCMINLPDYLGELCAYEITNSYASIYMMHEFEIPDMTGVVTAGYDNVRLADGSFLVPLLYPAAQKLLTAAQNAREQGYRLKIYDSYRPNVATREMYSLAGKVLDSYLPARTYTGVDIADLNLPSDDPTTLTYGDVMLGNYSLNSFVARNVSNHNRGIALDLTIEDLNTGEEIRMQSSIHDLSQYSALSRNNKAANVLSNIMKGADFTGLASEWWHFQDDDAKKELNLATVSQGVSAEGWMADDYGWKYRMKNGSYYENVTLEMDGREYTFDENGYITVE